jgi:outer membrane protein assembly factor BamB
MARRPVPSAPALSDRRAALTLGGALLLGGCETVTDWSDSLLGRRKVPLPGERVPVLAASSQLEVDPEAPPLRIPVAAAVAEWPQPGGAPGHAPGHPTLEAPLNRAWSLSVGSGASYRRRLTSPPVIAGNAAFAMDAVGRVTAVEVDRGQRRWELDTRPRRDRDGALGGGCTVQGDTVFIVTGLAEAMAVNAADATERWRVPLPAPGRGAPTVAGGRVYVPTIENQLLALSAETGERQWTFRAQSSTTIALGLPAPAVEGEMVVAGFGSGELAAIRATDGRAVWTEALTSARGGGISDLAAITALPVIADGRVFAGGQGGLLIAIDLRSGRRIWEREVPVAETPWVIGDALFAVTTGADLVCLGRDDGRVHWLRALDRFERPDRRRDPIIWGPPALAGGRLLIAGSHGRLVQINPLNGEPEQEQRLPGPTTLAPAFAGGGMLVLTDDATLVWLRGSA